MKVRLAILALLAGGALLTSGGPTPPAAADDYWIGDYAYPIPGADVRAFVYCQADRRLAIYELTATDIGPWRYWLGLEDVDVPDAQFSGTGFIAISGGDMDWPLHAAGDVVTVSVWGGPCWPRDEDRMLAPRYARWLPLVLR